MVLPKMQIVKYIWGITLLIVLVQPVSGQHWKKSFDRYLHGSFNEQVLNNTQQAIIDDPHYLTLKALYTSDAEAAFELYQKALHNSRDNNLNNFINDKIADYYYASGLYLTAQKYKVKISTGGASESKSPERNQLKANIYLQFGVFSSRQNANTFIKDHQQRDLQLRMLERDNNFYVVSGPYFSEDEARLMKSDVNSRHKKLKPFVKRF